MVCLHAAPRVQLFASAGNGWTHNALRYHWLMPISCHFRDCKALLSICSSCGSAISRRKLPLYLCIYLRVVVDQIKDYLLTYLLTYLLRSRPMEWNGGYNWSRIDQCDWSWTRTTIHIPCGRHERGFGYSTKDTLRSPHTTHGRRYTVSIKHENLYFTVSVVARKINDKRYKNKTYNLTKT